MRIPQEKFDEIAQANDIVDVISSYTPVKRKTKNFIALCPFHPDKNPSLHISPQKQVYHCFACGASGNVFTFIQEYEKTTFIEAAIKLAERAGVKLDLYGGKTDLTNEISRLFEINRKAAAIFYENLKKLDHKDPIKKYLNKRGIDSDTVKKFGIGYSKSSWNALYNEFMEEGIFKEEELFKAGLIAKREKEKKNYYDVFRSRLMFPIFNENDKVVGFGGRKLDDKEPGGKYINSPETKIYNKSKILYGLNFAKESIRSKDYLIIVEGYMDVISLFMNGIRNVAASSGTALTSEQVQLISRYTKNVVLIFDADTAGIKAAKRGIELVLEGGLDLWVVSLPEGEDPDSFIRKNGPTEFEKYINKKQSIISFIAGQYQKENKLNTPEEKAEFVKEIIGYIIRLSSKTKIALYVKDLADYLKIYESDLRDEVNKAYKEFRKQSFPKTSVVIPKPQKKEIKKIKKLTIPRCELDLLQIFIHGTPKAIEYIENNIDIKYISHPSIVKAAEIFLDEMLNEGRADMYKIVQKIDDDELRALISEIAVPKHEISSSERIPENATLLGKEAIDYLKFAKDVIRAMKICSLEREIAELKKDSTKYKEVVEAQKEINRIRKENS